ncbi:ABC-type transport system periplasmic substrate-binding protein (probable substrate sugar) (plasmid) [Halobacterium hubeiense]|uniref:ABC-type transport system periplasmic substrate-binding protein (Probable substrate sugar) n=1 Tax=Halobacterium hubeiense TaxID=1407499 RepID=A0A0U5D1B5_9EURY|nr:ABC transporter substrate-binding protein [Halobacterium hubeiense]CQH63194.1 ABC-type transport system periplasmic substrate-binding protein (probable substrate sugar) [Halobacterium hubeiense]
MVDNDKHGDGIDRRTYLGGLAAAAAAGTAGCLGGGGDDSDGGGGGGGSSQALEVLHGWTGGDGSDAVDALTEAFNEAYPDLDSNIKAVGGQGNVELNTTVLRRLTNANPMGSFANWPGKNLERYRGSLMDHEDVWEEAGYKESMQDRVVELCTFNDKMPAVPIGSHRMNNLFYNTAAFEEAGIDPANLESVPDFVDALETIGSETDYTPFAHGMQAPFLGLQTWAQILTSQSGVEAYENFIAGDGDRAAVIDALETLQEIQENYITEDASSIGYTQAAQKLIADEAACIHGGNWLYGMFRADDEFNFGEEWDWVPFPGTEGLYFYHVDAFVTPSNNPTPEKTRTWQEFVGTKEAQIAFNNLKGSVPLRTDIDPSELSDFLAMTYEDLTSSDAYPPTIAHGLAVEPEAMNACKSAIGNNFMGPYDAEAAADGLLEAVSGGSS